MITVSEIVNKLRVELDGVVLDEPKHRMLNQLLLDIDAIRLNAAAEGYKTGYQAGYIAGWQAAADAYKVPSWEEKHGMI